MYMVERAKGHLLPSGTFVSSILDAQTKVMFAGEVESCLDMTNLCHAYHVNRVCTDGATINSCSGIAADTCAIRINRIAAIVCPYTRVDADRIGGMESRRRPRGKN